MSDIKPNANPSRKAQLVRYNSLMLGLLPEFDMQKMNNPYESPEILNKVSTL